MSFSNNFRGKSINFSSAYAPFFSGVFAPSKTKIKSYDDLDGMTIGVTGGTLEDLELTEKAPKGANIVRFGDNAATLSAIKSGQVQVLVAGNTAAASLTDADPSFDLKTKFIIKESPCFIGIKKGNEDLCIKVHYHKKSFFYGWYKISLFSITTMLCFDDTLTLDEFANIYLPLYRNLMNVNVYKRQQIFSLS